MKRWLAILPLAALIGLGVLTASQLMQPEKPGFDEGEYRPGPTRIFQTLAGEAGLVLSPPPAGQPILVNLFASWCGPCEAEHPLLVELGRLYPDQIYGIAYKDRVEDTEAFLSRLGNPYTEVGLDPDGQGGLDFGLTGVPETFVLSAEGQIILHIRGQLVEDNLDQIGVLLEAPGT